MIMSPFVLDRNVPLIGPPEGGQIGTDRDEQAGVGKDLEIKLVDKRKRKKVEERKYNKTKALFMRCLSRPIRGKNVKELSYAAS